jgi:hypothetical protein
LGKYYTLIGSSLYVYATRGDSMLDFARLPDGVGVFGSEVGWRLSPWLGVSDGVSQQGLGIVELVLQSEGHLRVDVAREALEEYFLDADDRAVESIANAELESVVQLQQWTLDEKPITSKIKRSVRRRGAVRPVQLQRKTRSERGGS